MNKLLRYMLVILLAGSLLTADAWAVTRKPKPTGGGKTKTADTTKPAPQPKGGEQTPALPVAPSPKDSAKGAKVSPTKFNDFLDKNKNGVDDRLEKCATEKKKPSTSTTKSKSPSKTGESKKTVSPTIKKTITKKSK